MKKRRIAVNHPMLKELKKLDEEVSRRFLKLDGDYGLGPLGLILDETIDDSRYDHATPGNCHTFATTGGEGVHFSFLALTGEINARSPVVVTIPGCGMTFVLGADLFNFLCVGFHRGYFSLEQVAYDYELTVRAYTGPTPIPLTHPMMTVGDLMKRTSKDSTT